MKILWTLLICALTIYAPIELTRVIVISALIKDTWVRPDWQFILEIVLLWVMYLVGMFLVYKVFKWQLRY